MDKKVLIINGSARRQNTFGLLAQIEQLLKKHDIETEMLHLFDYTIGDCIGCEKCIYQDGCSLNDDMPLLKQKILDSDGVVFGSPVYMRGVTSKLKTLADRTCAWFHKPEPAAKPVLSVTTTVSTGVKAVEQFLASFATGFGARKGGFIVRKVKDLGKPIEEKEVARFVSLLKNDKSQYRPAMGEVVMFNVQKVLALKSSGTDNAFWQGSGWIDKPYYYGCKLGVFKKLFSKMMFGILSKAMK